MPHVTLAHADTEAEADGSLFFWVGTVLIVAHLLAHPSQERTDADIFFSKHPERLAEHRRLLRARHPLLMSRWVHGLALGFFASSAYARFRERCMWEVCKVMAESETDSSNAHSISVDPTAQAGGDGDGERVKQPQSAEVAPFTPWSSLVLSAAAKNPGPLDEEALAELACLQVQRGGNFTALAAHLADADIAVFADEAGKRLRLIAKTTEDVRKAVQEGADVRYLRG